VAGAGAQGGRRRALDDEDLDVELGDAERGETVAHLDASLA
jgi:hypothetical protein